jgi:hypothetical protein
MKIIDIRIEVHNEDRFIEVMNVAHRAASGISEDLCDWDRPLVGDEWFSVGVFDASNEATP